ncbi:hypothetical protein OWR29_28795 [Actinoplanes sp. Pm04-4]|uniref:Uncharacterized protein n=1 Tax=Paractinoplanes pyxinae TaxID=2997416 RepID=A0ABT4B671_9ACTN|nr:hypothetical protein [Actinoplanes pyxinae]MCY1142010.1 hypothetical protein [Actinoplanes pyxinae]
MTIKKTGGVWRGDSLDDLTAYLREYRAGGYPVQHVKEVTCRQCQQGSFRVLVDDEQGCALTICLGCGTTEPLADSSDQLDGAELGECACPCGGETFAVAVGFAMTTDDEVRWISVGLRCLTDGTLGVYSDWKIDYAPTAHLLAGG